MRGFAAVVGSLLVASLLASEPAGAVVRMDWVTIGNPGNPPDPGNSTCGPLGTDPCGSVPYVYQISRYEVTNAQYAEFLNAVDPDVTNALGLWDPLMAQPPTGGINHGPGQPGQRWWVLPGMAHKPVNHVSWLSAARFANWMRNGQGSGSTEQGAYTFLGGTPIPSNASTIARQPNAAIFVPSENEWYKAAYHEPLGSFYFDYPTSSSSPPTCNGFPSASSNRVGACGPTPFDVGSFGGSPSPYGTLDQGGNVSELTDGSGLELRHARGGSFADGGATLHRLVYWTIDPGAKDVQTGFRLARRLECDDGLDNDGDQATDLADSGCSSAGDTSESADPAVVDVGRFYLTMNDANPPLSGSFGAGTVGAFLGPLRAVGSAAASGTYSVTGLGPPVRSAWSVSVISSLLLYSGSGVATCPLSGCNSGDDLYFVGDVTVLQDPFGHVPDVAQHTTDGSLRVVSRFERNDASICLTSGSTRCMIGSFALNAFPIATTQPGPGSSNQFDSSYYSAVDDAVVPFQASVTFDFAGGGETSVTASSGGPAPGPQFATETAEGFRGTYYDVTTNGSYIGGVTFCATYPEPPPPSVECGMRLLHGTPSPGGINFADATIASPQACPLPGANCGNVCIDTTTNRICAFTLTLSPFVTALDLRPACSNTYDDDGDGHADYPDDPQCASASDPYEQTLTVSIQVDTTADGLVVDGQCSLREAIRAANTDTAVDTCAAGSEVDNISIPAGVYSLSVVGADEDDSLTGDLDVRSSLILLGAGAGETVIDASGLGDRVLDVQPPEAGAIQVGIHDLTLRGGNAGAGAGGGLLIRETDPPELVPTTVIDGCVIENNAADAGGGVRLEHPGGGETTISRSIVRSNTASGGAGGIDSFAAAVSLLDSTVEDNTALGSGISGAGGIFDNKAMLIRRSTISGNQSQGGPGGIGAAQDVLSVGNSTISGNTSASGAGGGLAVGDNSNPASVQLTYVTIANNHAAQGGGLDVGSFPGSVVTTVASVVAGNTAATDPDVRGPVTSLGDHVIGIQGTSSGWIASDQVGSAGTPLDAKLAPLAANGGLARTHELLVGSPALNSADCIGVIEDQRHVPRPYGAACDAGALESTPACSDTLDNDGDGLVDLAADPGCGLATSPKENPQCNDGIDNDGDGLVDHPADPGCSGFASNDFEVPPASCGLLGIEAALLLLGMAYCPAIRRTR